MTAFYMKHNTGLKLVKNDKRCDKNIIFHNISLGNFISEKLTNLNNIDCGITPFCFIRTIL